VCVEYPRMRLRGVCVEYPRMRLRGVCVEYPRMRLRGGRGENPRGGERLVGVPDLLGDLARGEVGAKAHGAGGTERALLGAADLARDADGVPRARARLVVVADHDGLDAVPVLQLHDELEAALRRHPLHHAAAQEREVLRQLPAHTARQVGRQRVLCPLRRRRALRERGKNPAVECACMRLPQSTFSQPLLDPDRCTGSVRGALPTLMLFIECQ